jgi:hypothetical protein
MRNVRRRTAALGAVALVCSLAFASVALGALPGAPRLVSPKHGAHLAPGHVTLVVHDTAVLKNFTVFVQISKHRKLNKFGNLADCNAVSKGCDFLQMKPRKGHPGQWIYKTNPNVSFPGWWATTPGTYYWQADHVNCSVTGRDSCHVTSKIGSFHVG